MSRIGRKPVPIPPGVEVRVEGRAVTAKGPAGEARADLPEGVSVSVESGQIRVACEDLRRKPLWGTWRARLNNLLSGVARPFSRRLEISGVGYRAALEGRRLMLTVGYSHPVSYTLPEGVSAAVEKQTTVVLTSVDKEKLGQAAAEIRALRPPDAYKGKGIRLAGEALRRKAGKAAVAGAAAGAAAKK